MLQDFIQCYPILWSDSQTWSDKILTFCAERSSEGKLWVTDLLVFLEGDVPADHVVEEDTERPDCERIAVISTASDPLRRSVDSGAWKYFWLYHVSHPINGLGEPSRWVGSKR